MEIPACNRNIVASPGTSRFHLPVNLEKHERKQTMDVKLEMQTFGSRVKPRLWVTPPLPRPATCPSPPPPCLAEKRVTLRVWLPIWTSQSPGTSNSDPSVSCCPQPPATSNSESVTLKWHQECWHLTSFPDHDILPDRGTRNLGRDLLRKSRLYLLQGPTTCQEWFSSTSCNSWPLNQSGSQQGSRKWAEKDKELNSAGKVNGLSWFKEINAIVGMSFPGGSVVKNPPTNAGEAGGVGSIPESGRTLGGGNGNPLQYSC